tara:strand:+ start:489 stop:1121 length:633 start_codon:yes stop_codon:yes gene_type:complete
MAAPRKITGLNEQGNIITDIATGKTASGGPTKKIPGQAGISLKSLDRQPKSSNGLLPTSYQFTLARLPHVTFFCQSVNLPGVRIEKGVQGSPFHDIDIPAGKPTYGDLRVTFIIDEKMKNWMEISDWMTSLLPSTTLGLDDVVLPRDRFSDASLIITTNQSNAQILFKFTDTFPLEIADISFTSTQTTVDPITCEVTFAYTELSYEIIRT